jgi:hypothetical protein
VKSSWITKIRGGLSVFGTTAQNRRLSRLILRFGILIVFTALVNSCGAPPTVQESLRNPDPQVKIIALIQVAEEDRKELFPEVLANLHSKDETIRFLSGVVARKLSGQDVDFKAFASADEQEAAIALWRLWWEQRNSGTSRQATEAAAVSVNKDFR